MSKDTAYRRILDTLETGLPPLRPGEPSGREEYEALTRAASGHVPPIPGAIVIPESASQRVH